MLSYCWWIFEVFRPIKVVQCANMLLEIEIGNAYFILKSTDFTIASTIFFILAWDLAFISYYIYIKHAKVLYVGNFCSIEVS